MRKKKAKISEANIDFIKVCSLDSLVIESESRKKIFKRLLGRVSDLFFLTSEFKSFLSVDFFFFKSMRRPDYDELFDSVFDSCKSRSKSKYTFSRKRTYLINLSVIIDLIRQIRLIFLLRSDKILGRIYLYATAVFCLTVLKKISGSVRYKYLVTFADMQPLDNIFVQYAKLHSIPSVTLQHGLYIDYTKYNNVNIVNYKNMISDFFLSWGLDTKRLINKYHPEIKVVICGKPIKKIGLKRQYDYFTVIFDQNLFHEFNKKLLEIAYQVADRIKMKINLRLHPYNKRQWYKIDSDIVILDGEINNSRFAIGHTSSLLYEMMRLGIPSFKYKSEIPSNNIEEFLIFENSNELVRMTRQLIKKFDFSEYAKEYISYIEEESLRQYRKFFGDLYNGEF